MSAWTDAHPGWNIVGYAPTALDLTHELHGFRVQVRRVATGAVISGVRFDISAALQDVA